VGLDWADYGFVCTTNTYTEIKGSIFINTTKALLNQMVEF